jgi:hypothetical protein
LRPKIVHLPLPERAGEPFAAQIQRRAANALPQGLGLTSHVQKAFKDF